MKILISGPINYHYSRSICECLKKKECDVCFYPMTEFYMNCSYVERKLFKMGLKSLKRRYHKQWEEKMVSIAKGYNPDIIVFLNGMMLSHSLLMQLEKIKKVWWLWDSIERMGTGYYEYLRYFSSVCVFEYNDILRIKEKYSGEVVYLPLGYDEKIFTPSGMNREIDISFIGTPNKNRLTFLEEMAKICNEKNWTMYVGGVWYDTKLPWKKIRFKHKYPYLYNVIRNRIHSAEECADIYRKSKICLNISVLEHKSVNPRTFEILACETCQLINDEVELNGLLKLGRDLESYRDFYDAVNKIERLLDNDEQRKGLAKTGFLNNKGNSLSCVITKIEDICRNIE